MRIWMKSVLAFGCMMAASVAGEPQGTAADAARLATALKRVPDTHKPKNIILFIGDGMGINSVTAGRIFASQQRGGDGIAYDLAFEKFPYSGFSRTHSADQYVTDSANGISAITTGVKTINGAIGVDANVKSESCAGVAKASIPTLFEDAKKRGLAAGVVTTSGITDATPAGAYGHTSTRGWRSDADLPKEAAAAGCTDLAWQLVDAPAAIRMDVALGGDRLDFLPAGGEVAGARQDGRNLIETWKKQSAKAAYVANAEDLAAVDAAKTDHLLGLFADGDLPSPVDKDYHKNVPDLAAMTRKAIEVLKKNKNGFILMVESASIDKWHHRNNAYRALTDVDELSNAVAAAAEMTSDKDTLIILTADHSHGLTLSGGLAIGAPVMGLAQSDGQPKRDRQGNTYPALTYATGPGEGGGDEHPMLDQKTATDPAFKQPALVPMNSAAHAGEDVPVYAQGPQAYLVSGSFESTYLYQVMRHALEVKPK
ncbi:alkaline phosphatase [Rhizomicrobium palustre]|uniref:Alkaline phosphatase n=1 Tax=Rhizomicrobium palustre TaxID=189966 RepID=A0A846MTF9_9PROT|nr:alkaline phosphatase [Rhizomicrobium palustre]NIK86788.1 alkaline phosphatase [Rhizomicrobium palustre]